MKTIRDSLYYFFTNGLYAQKIQIKEKNVFFMSSFSGFQQNKIGQDKLVFFQGLGIYGRRGSDPAPCINHKRGLRNDWQASLGIRNIRSQESGSWGEGHLST